MLHVFVTVTTPSYLPTALGFSKPTVLRLKKKIIPLLNLGTQKNNNGTYGNSYIWKAK